MALVRGFRDSDTILPEDGCRGRSEMTQKPDRRRLDDLGIVIIGAGASALYAFFELRVAGATGVDQQRLLVTSIGLILLISLLTQLLLNQANRAKRELAETNANLEQRVRERTAALAASETRYRTIFENTGAATVIVDRENTILLANSGFVRIAGAPREEIENTKSWLAFLDPLSRRQQETDSGPTLETGSGPGPAGISEAVFIDAGRDRKDLLVTRAPIPDTESCVISFVDISQLKQAQRQIYRQAFHDDLTGLPNRALFMEHVNMAVRRIRRRKDYHFAVIYLDIDRFKLINDSLGHRMGDQMLKAFSARLLQSVRDVDTVARFGGDEFVILLDDVRDNQYAILIAERLHQNLKAPFLLNENQVFAPASMGIVLDTRSYEMAESILRDADLAMYQAKEDSLGHYCVFDKALHEKAVQLLQCETDLRHAIQREEFDIHFQPIVDVQTTAIKGLEALVRWHHPSLGLLYPDAFVSVAEETGLIIPISRWVLRRACLRFQEWQEAAKSNWPFFLCVNISSRHFLRAGLIDDVTTILQETGFAAQRLVLEITETTLMQDAEEAIRSTRDLKELGVRILIDDFGTGYSSLSYLQQIPIDGLKVDREFVSRVQDEADGNRNIVEAIVSLAHRLGLEVIAEGVETASQHALLRQLQCQLAQGYYFSTPLPSEDLDRVAARLAAAAESESEQEYRVATLVTGAPPTS